MTLVFELYFPTTAVGWIGLILFLLAEIFLVLTGFRMKNSGINYQFIRPIIIVGIAILVWEIISIFLPIVRGVSASYQELEIGFSYDFVVLLGIHSLLLITLGITFFMFGHRNKKPNGNIISTSGIFLFIALLLNMIFVGILRYIQWFVAWHNPVALTSYIGILEIGLYIIYGSALISTILTLGYSLRIQKTYFTMFGTLFFAAILLELLSFLGII